MIKIQAGKIFTPHQTISNGVIQVENGVSAAISRIKGHADVDLIAEQIRLGLGEKMGYTQDDVGFEGEQVDIVLGVKDNLVVAGYKDDFVKAVLDTTSSNSLAAQADYTAAMSVAGSSNESFAYLNVPALEAQIGRAAYPSDPSTWTLYYKPYFDHVGGIAWAVVDGSTTTVRLVVTAR